MNIPAELKYTSDHEWVSVANGVARVGITDYAQDALGDVVYVDLPASGDSVQSGASVGEVESTKSVSDIYAPLSGTIAEVNESLEATPGKLNDDPYGDGWLVTIELSDPDELSGLLDAAAYQELTAE